MAKFRIKELAQGRGLTQEALWLRVKEQGVSISLGTIQRLWQNDRASEPRASTLIAIARALGVAIDQLYSDDNPSYTNSDIRTPSLAAA